MMLSLANAYTVFPYWLTQLTISQSKAIIGVSFSNEFGTGWFTSKVSLSLMILIINTRIVETSHLDLNFKSLIYIIFCFIYVSIQ